MQSEVKIIHIIVQNNTYNNNNNNNDDDNNNSFIYSGGIKILENSIISIMYNLQ